MTVAKQGPKTVQRSHPRGDQGTKLSLSEIVKKVEKGRLDPRTRAWTIETIKRSGLGGFKADKLMQAKAIFKRLRAERVYVEDPVDGEFMQSSACTLEGCDGLMFLGGDCDDLVIAFLSAIESVGIEGALVAHGYDQTRQHTHVLAAVRDERRGTWVRCDPSTEDPFGTVSKPTRETFLGIPGGKVLADNRGAVDASKVGSALGDVRPTGDFVGVGKPYGTVGADLATAEPALEGITEEFYEYLKQEVTRITEQLAESWYELKFKHEQLRAACDMMNELAGGGYDLVEPETATTDNKLPAWTQSFEAYYQSLAKWVPVMIRYGREVGEGTRRVAWDPDGEFGKTNNLGYDKSTVVILGREGESFVGMTEQNRQIIVCGSDKNCAVGSDPAPGSVGSLPIIIGAAAVIVVVGSALQYLMVREVCDAVKTVTVAAETKRTQTWMGDMAERYGVEKAKEMQALIDKGKIERARNEVERDKVSPFSKIMETAETGLNALVVLAIAAAAVYGVSVAVDLFSKRKAAST